MNNKHDKFIKEQLSKKENAIDFLKIAIPEAILDNININSIQPTSSTFITEELKEIFADIIYTCQLKDGSDAFCSILIEHKSYKDPYVGFQIGSYLFGSYRQQIKNKEPFRIILPLVFYHHEVNWTYKPIEEYFINFPVSFLKYIPKFEVEFFGVNNLSDQTIFNIRNVAISTMLMTQKHHHDTEELLDRMEKIYESLQTQEERNSFNYNFVYILIIGNRKSDTIEIIKKNKDKLINKVFMTLYEEITNQSKI
ncbi:MAG TPA: Rpn family recombination-promoting nuclease/putative transposase, partial [Saprospiraceae bacterium]|nr:Rpn family recombination-promoting nuclease/putative transposase [Saprospiraceae bacterium]